MAKVTVTYANITAEEQEALNKELNHILALMWRRHLLDGGDPEVFKWKDRLPSEAWDEYLIRKRAGIQ